MQIKSIRLHFLFLCAVVMGQHQPRRAPEDLNKKGRSALWTQPRGLLQSAPGPQPLTTTGGGRAPGQTPSLVLQVRIPHARRNRKAAQDSRLRALSAHWFPNRVFWWVSNRTRRGQRLPSARETPGTGSRLTALPVADTGVPSPGALGKDAVSVLKEQGTVRRTRLVRHTAERGGLRALESAVRVKERDGAGSRTPKVRPAWSHPLVAPTLLQNPRNAVLWA